VGAGESTDCAAFRGGGLCGENQERGEVSWCFGTRQAARPFESIGANEPCEKDLKFYFEANQ